MFNEIEKNNLRFSKKNLLKENNFTEKQKMVLNFKSFIFGPRQNIILKLFYWVDNFMH